jgi:RNA polymerase sigma-32 factor
MEFQDTLIDNAPSPESVVAVNEELIERRQHLNNALETLSERERHIFVERKLSEDPKTLEELGQHYGISRERVRQLEARAFEKVQSVVMQEAAALAA